MKLIRLPEVKARLDEISSATTRRETEMTELTASWEQLVEMLGQHLTFAACHEHVSDGLRAIEGKTGRVIRTTGRDDVSCTDGHAPATWLFYTLGRQR